MSGEHYKLGEFQAWDVTRYMSGDLAQAWQYVFRCDVKSTGDEAVKDLRKAIDFLEDYIAHPEIPPSLCPHEIQQTEESNVLMWAMFDVDRWKVYILFEIHSAAFFIGKSGGGDQFDGRRLLVNKTVPAIRAEIARRENA